MVNKELVEYFEALKKVVSSEAQSQESGCDHISRMPILPRL
jgi:hypothetical protein